MSPETYSSGPSAVLGALLALVGLGLVPLAVALARHLFPMRVVFFARWGFSHVLVAFAVVVLMARLAIEVAPGTDLLTGFHRTVATYAVLGVVIAAVARRTHPSVPEALGLARARAGRAVLSGVAVLLLLLPGLLGVGLLWPWLCGHLDVEYAPQPVLLAFLDLEGGALAWACFLAIVVIPFFEELIFRGFLQPLLCQNLSEQGGIVLTSIFFANLHGASAFLPIFALSWMMGAVLVRTHSLYGPWAMHATFNALNLGLLLLLPADSRDLFL